MAVAELWSTRTEVDASATEIPNISESPDSTLSHDFAIENRLPTTVRAAFKRQASYEKYLAITLPSLKEELTPLSTPVTTLSRATAEDINLESGASITIAHVVAPSFDQVSRYSPGTPPASQPPISLLSDIELEKILNNPPAPGVIPTSSSPVSTEVYVVEDTKVAEVLQGDSPRVFYSTEIICVIYRCESRDTGLLVSVVWGWRGKDSNFTEKKRTRLEDMAQRYGTSLVRVNIPSSNSVAADIVPAYY